MGRIVVLFDKVLEQFSRFALIGSLFFILGLAVLSIVLRWLGSSLMWLEPLIRHLVFISAFLGGSLATSKGVHIKVDVFTHLIEKSNSKTLLWLHSNVVRLFCFITCSTLTLAGWDFYLVEKEFGAPAFLELPSAFLVGIIPVGMGLISLRFLNQILMSFFTGETGEYRRI